MKTTGTTFFRCNLQGEDLFAVRPDIPSEDALNWASALLDTVDGLLSKDDSHTSFGALVLVKMAKAAIDAVDISDSKVAT